MPGSKGRRSDTARTLFFALTPLALALGLRGNALSQPAYWDETYYLQYTHALQSVASLKNFFPMLTVNHPPLYFAAVGLLCRPFGWSLAFIHAVSFVCGLTLLALFYRVCQPRLGSPPAALATLAVCCSPVFLSQLPLCQPEIAKSALAFAALLALERRRPLLGGWLFCAGCWVNLPTLFLVPAFLAYLFMTTRSWRVSARFFLPALMTLPVWFVWLLWVKGSFNALVFPGGVAHFSPFAFAQGGPAVELPRRFRQIFLLDGRWLLSAAMLAAAWRSRRLQKTLSPRSWFCVAALVSEWFLLGLLPVGGHRYFLFSSMALVYLGFLALQRLIPKSLAATGAFSATLAAVGLFSWFSPPNLDSYREYRAEQHDYARSLAELTARLERDYPNALVYSQWPISVALSDPALGYVHHRYETLPLPLDHPRKAALLHWADQFGNPNTLVSEIAVLKAAGAIGDCEFRRAPGFAMALCAPGTATGTPGSGS